MPKRNDIHKILIIGSGPIVIGQACEFDYSGTQACKALRSLGYEIVLVNSNPATIMTDPEMADYTYIEPLNEYAVTEIIKKERPDALLPNLGGQTALNLSLDLANKGILEKYNVEVIGARSNRHLNPPSLRRMRLVSGTTTYSCGKRCHFHSLVKMIIMLNFLIPPWKTGGRYHPCSFLQDKFKRRLRVIPILAIL